MVSKFFNLDLPFARFCWNVLVFSALSLFPLLIVYIVLSPGLGTMLLTNETALVRFMRQVLTNGVTVVFVINYAGFFALAHFQQQRARNSLQHLIFDVLARALLFVALHALIYVLSADIFASFSGDRGVAMQVVGPTLKRAFLFENISGVYLYGILPGAFIAYLVVFQERNAATSSNLPSRSSTITALGLCAAIVLLVTIVSVGLTYLLDKP